MENSEKVIALYKYIKELCGLKYQVVTDISLQPWSCYIDDIPDDKDNIQIFYRDRVDNDLTTDMALLTVRKPELKACPEPPKEIAGWINDDWDDIKSVIKIRGNSELLEQTEGATSEQQLEDFYESSDRVDALNKWTEEREVWITKQKELLAVRKLFTALYEQHIYLERESETLEMMVGNGIVTEKGNSKVNHPILLKRVKTVFDAKDNSISIYDTDSDTEIYTMLLQEMNNINHDSTKKLREQLAEEDYHPLDRNDTPIFLKILTHSICSDSVFIDDTDERSAKNDMMVTRIAPVYFIRKRIDGSMKAIEAIIDCIDDSSFIPAHLLEIIGVSSVRDEVQGLDESVENMIAALGGESDSILLAKEANKEQLEIAERIEKYNAVVVQGPPGTGKTHTIANLMGHFLSQGKSVLVTSHTKKALTVLKDKVPNEIKNLCVSVLDDTNADMVRSVDGISEYISCHNSEELKKKVESGKRERAEIIKNLADVRKKLYAIKFQEFDPIVFNGESFSLSGIGKFISENEDELSYIPGKVEPYCALPITLDVIKKLYQSNGQLSIEEENELSSSIPSPEMILLPSVFMDDIKQKNINITEIHSLSTKLELKIEIDLKKKCVYTLDGDKRNLLLGEPDCDVLNTLIKYTESIEPFEPWMIQAATDGKKNGGYLKRWDTLFESIDETVLFADSIVSEIIGYNVDIESQTPLPQLSIHLQKIHGIMTKKGKITPLDLFLNKSIEVALSDIKVNDKPINNRRDCEVASASVNLKMKRDKTAKLWNDLMAKEGCKDFYSLSDEPERTASQIKKKILRYLNWERDEYFPLVDIVNRSGINARRIFIETEDQTEYQQIINEIFIVEHRLPVIAKIAVNFASILEIEKRKADSIKMLSKRDCQNSDICKAIVASLSVEDCEQYELHYKSLDDLYAKNSIITFRQEALSQIERAAPDWADAIRARQGIHGLNESPQKIPDAWRWKQFVTILDSITSQPYEKLQHDAVTLSKKLHKQTEKIAADLAWYHLLSRTERSLEMQQSLRGWKLTIKKIGKGTGKGAPKLKKEARKLMSKCQESVPAWIMTINKAMESLVPGKNMFDVVIIDEASQSDISSLGILYLAKKVVIVGDDKQVSPMAVGFDVAKMNALMEMYIRDLFPNWHLFDAKTSLYDIAVTVFHPLMLREHFRCVPEIIGYCNKLSYDYKIKPLRASGTSPLSPPLVPYRVPLGFRDGKNKVNRNEAETIVALIASCIKQEEYKDMTFGVISMVGNDQANTIQQIIFDKIDISEIDRRRIISGNASQFQGDERDVIFLSLVDSNEEEGPLSMAGEGADQSRKQRYNVAVSRARDQIWIVHSFDPSKDLKSGDMRRDLLEYANNPNAFSHIIDKVRNDAESPFEKEVAEYLVAAGYNVVMQWEVGAYRIDMVVTCNGKNIALECDGEQYHSSEEEIRSDMERQAVLERIGWTFIRIRGSEYFRNPLATMKRVMEELQSHEILPESILVHEELEIKNELLERVKITAGQILDVWKNKPVIARQVGVTVIMPDVDAGNNDPKTVTTRGGQIGISTSGINWGNPGKKKGTAPLTNTSTHSPANSNNRKSISPAQSKAIELINSLRDLGIKYIDRSATSAIIWIPYSESDVATIEENIIKSGLRYSFEKRGSLATENQAAWRVMIEQGGYAKK